MDAAAGADLLVVVTEWNEFRALSPERLREAMAGDLIIDLRNLYEASAMQTAGFRYHSIGRP
jgi:UDPglucose 6-dehydrogenase